MRILGASSFVVLTLFAGAGPARSQDVVGIEICTKESRLDRRTSCLQSNVEFLQQLVSKNTLDAQQKLNAANREIAALKDALAGAGRDLAALTAAMAAMQAKLDQMQKVSPAAPAPGRPAATPQGK